MALLLHIDSATNICSVALSKDGNLIEYLESSIEKSHASVLSVFIDKILNQNDINTKELDAISVSKGPGSYTGLRIGVSTAKGLCYASDKPLIAIDSLLSLANGFINEGNIAKISEDYKNILLCPMLDARRMEVYTSIVSTDLSIILPTSAKIVDEQIFSNFFKKYRMIFFGNGSEKCQTIINHTGAFFIDNFNSSAKHLISLAEKAYDEKNFENVAYFEPFYLKDFVATIPKEKIIHKNN